MSDSLRAAVSTPVEYPSSDGRPMGETPVHRDCIIDVFGALQEWFIERPDVYIGCDMFVYYEEGNPRASVVPDVFVAVGAVKDELREGGWRDTYMSWEEPKGPDFVLEVTSPSTRRDDQVRKRELYGRLGVGEYFLYLKFRDSKYLEPGDGFPLPAKAGTSFAEPAPAGASGGMTSFQRDTLLLR